MQYTILIGKKPHDHLNRCRKSMTNPVPFMGKTLNKVRTDRSILNLIKVIYKKPTANITFNDE